MGVSVKRKGKAAGDNVIRDNEGDVIQAGAGRLGHASDAMHSELIACIQGVRAARAQGMGRIILETDALQVNQALSCLNDRLAVQLIRNRACST